jgi:hypothetical protein
MLAGPDGLCPRTSPDPTASLCQTGGLGVSFHLTTKRYSQRPDQSTPENKAAPASLPGTGAASRVDAAGPA